MPSSRRRAAAAVAALLTGLVLIASTSRHEAHALPASAPHGQSSRTTSIRRPSRPRTCRPFSRSSWAKASGSTAATLNSSPVCCPSRWGFLTGLYEHHTGVDFNGTPLTKPTILRGDPRPRLPDDAEREVPQQCPLRIPSRVRPLGLPASRPARRARRCATPRSTWTGRGPRSTATRRRSPPTSSAASSAPRPRTGRSSRCIRRRALASAAPTTATARCRSRRCGHRPTTRRRAPPIPPSTCTAAPAHERRETAEDGPLVPGHGAIGPRL